MKRGRGGKRSSSLLVYQIHRNNGVGISRNKKADLEDSVDRCNEPATDITNHSTISISNINKQKIAASFTA
jgi:hypothetical protein